MPARRDILNLVAQRFPAAPADTILRWIEEFTETSGFGTSILDAEFPPAMSMEPPPEVIWSALRYFVEGGDATAPTGAFRMALAGLQELRTAFLRSSLRSLAV